MNNDLISREALKTEMQKADIEANDYETLAKMYENCVDNAPTVKTYCYFCGQTEHGQIEERTQGKWVEVGDNQPYSKDKLYGCSKCRFGSYLLSDAKNVNFCPNCGADMRGDNDDG